MFRNTSRASIAAACAIGATLALGASAPAAQAATKPCTSTFKVLHDDRIGSLMLPNGHYKVRVQRLTCANAYRLFAAFLNDYDGKLPGGWRFTVRGEGSGIFSKSGTSIKFSVKFSSSGGGSAAPVGALTCSNLFTIENNDKIGDLSLPAGRYRFTRISTISPSCAQIPGLFLTFLNHPNGTLPNGYIVLAGDGAFVQGSRHIGFHVKPAV